MTVIATQQTKVEDEAIEINEDGNLLFRVPHLIPHMTKPDRVKILQWHIKEGNIVRPNNKIVTFDFLGDDWHMKMPPLGPLRVLKIVVAEGDVVHLHDPVLLLEPVPLATESQPSEKGFSEF